MKKIIALAVGLAAIVTISACGKSVSEGSETYLDLKGYYGIEDGKFGMIVNGKAVDNAIIVENSLYLPQDSVAEYIDSRFFYDEENRQIRYALPTEIITTDVGGDDGRVIRVGNDIYLSLDYVVNNSSITYEIASNPDRVVIFTEMGIINTYTVNKESVLRVEDSKGADIMCNLAENQILYPATEELELYSMSNPAATGEESGAVPAEASAAEWVHVTTQQGVTGYVSADAVQESQPIERVSEYQEPEYTHQTRDYKICLGWHQLFNMETNLKVNEILSSADPYNVISPTWFSVVGDNGEIASLASADYVDDVHRAGKEVWALISDFEKDDNGSYYILSVLKTTETRTNLINNIMSQVERYNIDGINVDFEKINGEAGSAYVQFIRELSIECREAGIVLSVDMYVPANYNLHYGREDVGMTADYVIVMGYDEHWAGCGEAGSVASIQFVRNGIANTLKFVESDRVINGVPFYTRIWCETPEDLSDGSGTYVEDSVLGNYYLTSVAYSMEAAMEQLNANNAVPYWLESEGQYYAEYQINGATYRVWLEEEESMSLKLDAMEEADLAGVACWKLGYEKPQIRELLSEYVRK